LALHLFSVATKTQTQRPKGGRMGSGKSPLVGKISPMSAGKTLLECKELRIAPQQSLLELRSAVKKIPLRCSVELVKNSF
jgi:ribosomal protein L16/L10AE